MEHINNYAFFIALAFSVCSLVALLFLFLYYRRLEKKCNHYLTKSLCEQSRVSCELHRTCMEKEIIEKLLKARLSEVVECFLMKVKTEASVMDKEKKILRIDITFLEKTS